MYNAVEGSPVVMRWSCDNRVVCESVLGSFPSRNLGMRLDVHDAEEGPQAGVLQTICLAALSTKFYF